MADKTLGIAIKGKDELSPVMRGIRNTMEGFKRDAATGFGLGAGISVFNLAKQAVGEVFDVMGDAVRAASDLAETQSKVGQVYRESGQDVLAWGEDAATAMGLSTQKALEAHATFGNFIQALGSSETEAREMSGALVQLAADLGSFNNTEIQEVLVALRSGLAGEAEPMRRLGVDVSAARVELELMEMGIEKVNGKFTESDKVLGRYRAIMEDTTAAQGDFDRTSDGLANTQKTLNAQMEDLSAELGEALLPYAVAFATALKEDLVPQLEVMVEHFKNLMAFAPPTEVPDFFESLKDGTEAVAPQLEEIRQQFALNDAQMQQIIDDNKLLILGYEEVDGQLSNVKANLVDTETKQARFLAAVFLAAEAARDETKSLDATSTALEETADTTGEAEAAAKALADQLSIVAKATLPEMRDQARETFAELKAGLEAQGDPMRVLQEEERKLSRLRREAMDKHRWDIAAAIDARLGEIETEKNAYQVTAAHYRDQVAAAKLLQENLDISREKAHKLLEKTREKYDIDVKVDDTEVARAIILMDTLGAKVKDLMMKIYVNIPFTNVPADKRQMGGPVSAGRTYLVGESGPELLVMGGSSGHVVPNHQMGGGGDVYLDGYLVGRVVDERLGRQYGTASRVTNYRRSN